MALAVPFVIGFLVMIAVWLVQNLPERLDWHWLKQGGGFLNDRPEKPPARRFNAGQKLVFWGVILGGILLTITGVGLMLPFYWSGYTGMQTAQVAHATIALLLIGLIIGHIYIGTIGMVGAFEAMWSGRVDRNWAQEHHSLWYRDAVHPQLERGDRIERPARAGWSLARAGAWTFGTGAVIAIIVAFIMAAVYGDISVTSSEGPRNAAVHLDRQDIALERRGAPVLVPKEPGAARAGKVEK
jgi:formate dehydrogenase gamma subunit